MSEPFLMRLFEFIGDLEIEFLDSGGDIPISGVDSRNGGDIWSLACIVKRPTDSLINLIQND